MREPANFAAYTPRRSRRGSRTYPIGRFVGAYLLAGVGSVTAIALLPAALVVIYPIAGICLSRYIGRRIIWWNQANNIRNVVGVKLRTILTWPVAVPVFIVQIFIARYL